MTFAYWSVVLATFLPLIWVGAAKFARGEDYDNSKPRESLAELSGWAQRANWAQANSYEALPPFAAGIIIAHAVGANQMVIDTLAGIFLISRILHGIFYITDRSNLRTLIWLTGYLSMVGLYLVSGWTTTV
jgi:uncharacterized MAPEG superfamily protein